MFFNRFSYRARHPLLVFQCHDVYNVHGDGFNLLPISFIGLCFCLVRWDFYDLYKLYAKIMHVANLYYKMNDLIRRHIEEVLDYDKNINAMVMKIGNNVGLRRRAFYPTRA